MPEIDCDLCQDTGVIGICVCAAYPDSAPCSGCTEPVKPGDDYRTCIDCDGLSSKTACDCPVAILFSAGCQNRKHE